MAATVPPPNTVRRATLRRNVWTAALAGGLLAGFLIKSPGTRLHPYWMVAIGGIVAIYVLKTLETGRGHELRFGQGTHVATLSAFIPGIVNWATLRPLYYLVVKEAEAAVAAAKGNPHVPVEQAQAWLDLVRGPSGLPILAAMTMVAFLFTAALAGVAWDLGMMMADRRSR